MQKIFDDPLLNSITDIKLAPIVQHGNIYEALMSSIISQQISTAAASSIKKKFTEYFGNIGHDSNSGTAVVGRYPTIDEVLNIENEKLRTLGLSSQKATYIKSVAEFFKNLNQETTPSPLRISGAVSHTASSPRGALNAVTDEELIKELTKIKGVGRWTVEMILIFTLGRPDVFAIDDLGLQQSVIKLYKLKKTKTLKKRILKISERWSSNRSLASRYLWAWRDSAINKK